MNPADLTQLDLQNLSPEEQAELARQQQAALAAQQHHALLGLLSAVPEAQKFGEMEYGQAGRERAGGQQTAGNVLRQALAQKELGLRGAQFQFEKEKFAQEFPLRQKELMYKIAAPFLQEIVNSDATERTIKTYAGIFGPSVSALAEKLIGTPAESRKQAALNMLKGFGVNMGGEAGPAASTPAVTAPKHPGLKPGERLVLDPNGRPHAAPVNAALPKGWSEGG